MDNSLSSSTSADLVFEHLAEISLDGSTCALRSAVDQSVLPTNMDPYTLEAEIKTTSSANQGIISWGNFGQSKQVNAFKIGSVGLDNFWWGADLTSSTGTVNIPDGSWHHVMATFDGTTRRIFLDGTELGSDTPTGLAVTKTDNFCVGYMHFLSLAHVLTGLRCRSSGNSDYFNGQMRSIKVWNTSRLESYAPSSAKHECEVDNAACMNMTLNTTSMSRTRMAFF